MDVLELTPHEGIFVNSETVITLLRIDGDAVLLSIDSPWDMPPSGAELDELLRRQKLVLGTG